MYDLQQLVPPGYPNLLEAAQGTNERGQITGFMLDPRTGQQLTFIATPSAR